MHGSVSFNHMHTFTFDSTLLVYLKCVCISKPQSYHINTLLHSLGKIIQAALRNVSYAIKMHRFTARLHFEGVWESFTVLHSSGFLTRGIIPELGIFKYSQLE